MYKSVVLLEYVQERRTVRIRPLGEQQHRTGYLH